MGAGAKGHGKRAGVIPALLLFFFFGFFPVLIFFILIAGRGIVVLVVDAAPTPQLFQPLAGRSAEIVDEPNAVDANQVVIIVDQVFLAFLILGLFILPESSLNSGGA